MNGENKATVTLWGKEISLLFGMRSSRKLRENDPDFLATVESKMPDEIIPAIIHSGLPSQYSEKTLDEVLDAIDEDSNPDEIHKAFMAWKSSMGFMLKAATGKNAIAQDQVKPKRK